MFQRDYILRMLQQAAQAIGRAFRALAEKKPDQAEQELAEAYAALGLDRELLLLLDASSLRNYFADEEKLAMGVRLLLCDAELQWHKAARRPALQRLRAAARLQDQLRAPDAALASEFARVSALLADSDPPATA
jgi:hypothetical protein